MNDESPQADSPQADPAGDERETESGDALSPDEFRRLLRAVRPADLLALLREPKFSLLAMSSFAGFRVSARALAQPLVLRRLAQDGLDVPEFAARVRDLTVRLSPAAEPAPQPRSGIDPAADKARSELERERERRRQEREQSRRQIQAAQEEIAALRRENAALRLERDEAIRRLGETARSLEARSEQAERLERRLARMKAERDTLLGGARAVKKPAAKHAPLPAAPDDPSPWADAVARIVAQSHPRVAQKIAEDVLRHAPKDLDALRIALDAAALQDDADTSAHAAAALAEAALEKGRIVAAIDAVTRLLAAAPKTKLLDGLSRSLIAGIREASQAELQEAVPRIDHLRAVQPKGYERLTALIRQFAPADAARTLAPRKAAIGMNTPLGLPGLPPGAASITARQASASINANDVETVAALRGALAALRARDEKRHAEIVAAVLLAADDDESSLVPLLKKPHAAAVLDASNAAWFDQESLVEGRPRLRHILELRWVLRARGYFPVVLIADAPLPYTIDRPEELRGMIDRHELTLVDRGVDADEVLIREARRLRAPLVTNDYMADWDPDGLVHKIRFGIPATGNAYLLE